MKILIYSPAFFPSVGGLESVVATLANEFVAAGHEVKIVSQTPASENDRLNYEVIRSPARSKLLALVRWSDVYFHANISLRGLWPLIFCNRPWVVSHNNWYQRADGKRAWQDRIKHYFARRANGISVSQAVDQHVGGKSKVIPNPYRTDVFHLMPEVVRTGDLVCAGRLVSDKGVDLLLDALALLSRRGIKPGLTVIGSGPEETSLRSQANDLGLLGQVEFVGVKRDEELAALLNAHRILVVPSRWQEPFGIVALEGIACGCVVVGSEGGGLKDAIGPCGVTYPNGDAEALAGKLAALLADDHKVESLRTNAESHLSKHQPAAIAQRYLEVFGHAILNSQELPGSIEPETPKAF
jgi:glycogen synthase